jgi:adenylate cyclase
MRTDPTDRPDPATPDDDAPETFITDPEWRAILEGTSSGFGSGRRYLRAIPASPRCKLCAAPFRGPGAPLMRLIDRGPWDKNPTVCGFCFKRLERNRGGAEIDLSILFADIRGSTGLAESLGPRAFQKLMNRFYQETTQVLVDHDAVVDKFVGDEVVALFIPALAGADHAGRAVDAARDLLIATGHGQPAGPWAPLGVGVHTGRAYVGSVGDTVTDFTALGDAVNVTARLASEAAGGEILVSVASADLVGLDPSLETRHLRLRGRTEPLDVRVLHA